MPVSLRKNLRSEFGLVKPQKSDIAFSCTDVSHPIAAGAEAFAKLFIEDVKARNLEVATLFQ